MVPNWSLVIVVLISNIIIQIMSKKAQPQKAENNKNKIQIVDQQNEPFLRALQKKVRNINKKLTEISELEGKDNLKPEQIEKINRKEALIEQRTRIEQNATFFKQVYAENAAHYRNNQLRELEVLARAISVYHTAPQIPEQARLSNLWRALQQHDTHANVNAAILSLADTLKEFANDRKLQKALTTYVQKHGNDEIKHVEVNQEKIVNDILAEKPEKQEVQVQEPAAKVEVVVPPQPEVPVVQTAAQPVVVQSVPEVAQITQVVVQQESTPIAQQPIAQSTVQEQAQQPPVAGERKQGERRDNRNRGNGDRPYRGKGNYRGNNRREGEGDRRQYKPKFQEKRGQQNQAEDSGSSDSEQEVRQFRRDQIKKLQDDGFIVVGKPKPKPKDVHEQQHNYEKQNGKKNHHHHRAENR